MTSMRPASFRLAPGVEFQITTAKMKRMLNKLAPNNDPITMSSPSEDVEVALTIAVIRSVAPLERAKSVDPATSSDKPNPLVSEAIAEDK